MITFASDYGLADGYVGICKTVIASIASDERVIDISHELGSIRRGAALLVDAWPTSPEAVHLAIVDPGVGTSRRAVALTTGSGARLVGPDNGLMIWGAEALGGVVGAHEIAEPAFMRHPVSMTFHGRDVFAPVAAHLSLGVPVSELGPPIEPSELVVLEPPVVSASAGELVSDVRMVDVFGNVQLAATAEHLAVFGHHRTLSVGGAREVPAVAGTTFADAGPGELVVYLDSTGHVAVAANGASAVDRIGAAERVTIVTR